jgi:uncharacterized membrane protein YccC
MSWLNRDTALFSANSFAAAFLALFIAFSIGLPQPYWAMTTAYIVSQPLSGAVRSKAIYRVLGTMLGGAAAVAMVPNLVNAPVLLSLALALWVGGCLAVSLLDRTPRSYVLMLAGYTAAIIGFPSVGRPEAVFDVAVARVVEISLGILCATLIHSLVFPKPVGDVISRRAHAWLGDADRWALDLLAGAATDQADDRLRLAAAASEIHLLTVHLPFDTSRLRETTGAVRALHDRMLVLIPILSGLSDRLDALRAEGAEPTGEAAEAMAAVAGWIGDGAPLADTPALHARIETARAAISARTWSDLLVESLLMRAAQLVDALGDAHALMAHISAPDSVPPPSLAQVIAAAGRQRTHSDLGLALLSGAAASLAILLTCAIWILGGWGDGTSAAITAAVFCCFFATLDDPAPAIAKFGVAALISLPISALYIFAILPMIDGFPLLVLVMAPPLLLLGLFMPDPRTAGAALGVILSLNNALALQANFAPDAASYFNVNLSQFVGMFAAIFVTRAIRSMSVEASAQRLLRRTWRALAELARADQAPAPADFAARLVDRLGLLTPKLAGTGETSGGLEALADLRIGMNIVALQETRPALGGAARIALDRLLDGLGRHFSARAAGQDIPPPTDLLTRLDATLRNLAAEAAPAGADALVGLRRNLFPKAAPFAALAPEALA